MTAHVCLLEDNYALRRFYVNALLKAGYDVTEVSNLKEANAAFDQLAIDVFVCDIELADGNAWRLLDRITAAGKPVVTMSACFEHSHSSREKGIDHFLMKPFPVRKLAEQVTDVLGAATGTGV
jgi:DNA-binding response OmpR family regulator